MSPDARDDNTDSQANEESMRPILQVNATTFSQIASGSDYTLYQTCKQRKYGNIVVDIFLEHVPHKGWLGGLHFKDIAGIYFEKESDVGFPTPEEALAATWTFVSLQEEGLRTLRSVHAERVALQCKLGRYDQMISIRIHSTMHN